jgi:hypothetical protein
MWNDYYHWLVDLLNNDYLKENYSHLLGALFDTEFTWSVDYDSNRASDGLHLRKEFAAQSHYILSSDRGCSVLEMLIAMCKKCDEELMYDPDLGDRTGQWFWMILVNLGLDIYDDLAYDPDSVRTIVERFLDRDYEKNGFGGPFYVCDSMCDFRDTDLWLQLNLYLHERFSL